MSPELLFLQLRSRHPYSPAQPQCWPLEPGSPGWWGLGAGHIPFILLSIASRLGRSSPALVSHLASGFCPCPRFWFPEQVQGLGIRFLYHRCFLATQVIPVPSGWALPCAGSNSPQKLDPGSDPSMNNQPARCCPPVPEPLSLGSHMPAPLQWDWVFYGMGCSGSTYLFKLPLLEQGDL